MHARPHACHTLVVLLATTTCCHAQACTRVCHHAGAGGPCRSALPRSSASLGRLCALSPSPSSLPEPPCHLVLTSAGLCVRGQSRLLSHGATDARRRVVLRCAPTAAAARSLFLLTLRGCTRVVCHLPCHHISARRDATLLRFPWPASSTATQCTKPPSACVLWHYGEASCACLAVPLRPCALVL